MFRIRQITSTTLPANRPAIEHVRHTLQERLPGLRDSELSTLEDRLRNPFLYDMQSMLFVADNMQGKLLGFAFMSHAPDLHFCLLDYIATPVGGAGGIGGALYERVRGAAKSLGAYGIFFECLPDEPEACADPSHAKQNAARLRFYERFGARPIIGTAYETPLKPGDKDAPHLVFDDLGSERPLLREEAQKVVRAILERKYGDLCSPHYVEAVVASIQDDPVRLRPPRLKKPTAPHVVPARRPEDQIILVVSDRHEIHHVRDRGYVEAPARVRAILSGIEPTGLFLRVEPKRHAESAIRAVHDPKMVDYLKAVCAGLPEGQSVYPYVFPVRNTTRPPKDKSYAAGYYCIDTFTPLNRNAYLAATRAVDCTLTAMEAVLNGQRFAYALVRPPGHHAETRTFGGFCYFCNAAIAAHQMSAHGRIAVLDVDYHHGNGQQDIFYTRADVLTVSIHGNPTFAYPFFTGFDDELGEGEGKGLNLNVTLPERVDGPRYHRALTTAIARIRTFAPDFLIVSLGFDTAKGDPTGTWSLAPSDFVVNGRMIAELNLPTLIVQEGGYRTRTLGTNAKSFFNGLTTGASS